MNERIRELAEQARDWGYAEHSGYTAQLLFEQKFAELVWKAAYEEGHDAGVDAGFEAGRNASFTEQNFGVEE
jgi:hypothetical protein